MKLLSIGLLLLILLSGCPYKRVFVAISNSENKTKELTITPITFFYHVKKNVANCDIVFKISNKKNTIQEMDVSASLLITSTDTLPLIDVTAMGNVPLKEIIKLKAISDTLIGLSFRGEKKQFGDTIKVVLSSHQQIYETFFYKRI